MIHSADLDVIVIWYLLGMLIGSMLLSWFGPPWRGLPWRTTQPSAIEVERLSFAYREGRLAQAKADAEFRELVGRAIARMDVGQHGLGYQLLQTAVGRPEGPHWGKARTS